MYEEIKNNGLYKKFNENGQYGITIIEDNNYTYLVGSTYFYSMAPFYKLWNCTRISNLFIADIKGGKTMDRRQIFTIIFGKECVSDEELWNFGFGSCKGKIEVESKNISHFNDYKIDIIRNYFLKYVSNNPLVFIDLRCFNNI